MQSLIQIFHFLITLFASAFLLRFIAQWVRADHRNPIAQAIMQITNPLVIPARRVIPGWKGKDMASLFIFIALLVAETILFATLTGQISPAYIFVGSLMRMTLAVLSLYFYIFILSAILSWVNQNPYNPVHQFLHAISAPVLRPLRKFIPLIGGVIDITPMIAILVIFFFQNESPRWFEALLKILGG